MRLRVFFVAAVASLALGAVGVPAAGAANGTTVPPKVTSIPALYKLPVTGVAKNGKKFTGTYTVKRFVAEGDDVFAVGTLKGTLKGRQVRRTGVEIPVSNPVFGESPLAQMSQQQLCEVLDLTLGPLDLRLLGLIVHLDTVHLDIDADPEGGLLGSLLCSLAGGVPPAPAPAPGGGILAQLLNAILALLRGL
jgi:hypothetical protein